ncbi:damage-control phosphatase ARMT1-like [Diprion similis]|uniref:damage-control phosphatase ARMT1-like n=1 Tax=Diprion similis TaxID=362088 RepID=UPI001EF99B22|nr:damage-control phosphatase ARMT1-like [Diprion similis]
MIINKPYSPSPSVGGLQSRYIPPRHIRNPIATEAGSKMTSRLTTAIVGRLPFLLFLCFDGLLINHKCIAAPNFITTVPNVTKEVSLGSSNSKFEREPEVLDTVPPFGVQLSPKYKRSGAFEGVTIGLPRILTRVSDSLVHDREEIVQNYSQSADKDLDQVLNYIRNLKNEILTNAQFKALRLSPNENHIWSDDIRVWNDYLAERTKIEGGIPRFYSTPHIYSECYTYRRIAEAFHLTETLKSYDPFTAQKRRAFDDSTASAIAVAAHTLQEIDRKQEVSLADKKQEFIKHLKLCLWGNKVDLAFSHGAAVGQSGNPLELLSSLDKNILVNNTDLVWDALTNCRTKKPNGTMTVDVVLDNAGYELFTDLSLSAFLISRNLADRIRFYVKRIPWLVSDVTTRDFQWIIQHMKNSSNPDLSRFGQLVEGHLETGVFSILDEPFWTSPFVFSEMPQKDPALYAKLSEASLAIIKGDLNYRKLIGDINWEYSTSILQAIRGFLPTNIVSLRTIKSNACVGLQPNQAESVARADPNWLTTAKYGLITAAVNNQTCSRAG